MINWHFIIGIANCLLIPGFFVQLVSEVLIGDIIKVLGFVVEDVINLPEKIANNVIEKLEKPVREPLESIVKLAEREYNYWCNDQVSSLAC